MKPKPKIIVFASGGKEGGGSGFRNLVEKSKTTTLVADIVQVVSNHQNGGVRKHAKDLGIPFIHMPKPYDAEHYQGIVRDSGAEWIALSGWLKLVSGLPEEKTINIHPGPLPEFGGDGLYGHYVHEAVLKTFHEKRIRNSAVTMHFVSEEYDQGPIFFRFPIPIRANDTASTLAARVNAMEHEWQPWATHQVVHGHIRLENGKLYLPRGYKFL